VTPLVEVAVDRGMSRGELLERFNTSEFGHCSLSSAVRLICIFCFYTSFFGTGCALTKLSINVFFLTTPFLSG
jgi:hypothetical protein